MASENVGYVMTGASGFLGRTVLEHLRDNGDPPVMALVRSADGWQKNAWARTLKQVDTVEVPMGDPDAVAEALATRGISRARGIFHFAALVDHSRESAKRVYDTNVGGTLAMVRLAARLKCRLVFASTSGVVGCFKLPGDSADEHAPHLDKGVERWPYYHSKVVAEQQARLLADELGVELVVLRPPVLLGPGDHRFRSTGHIIKMLRGRLGFLVRGGMHFVDVRDVASAMVQAMERAQVRDVYHLAGTECDIVSFFKMVGDVSGVTPPKWVLPYRVAHSVARLVHGAKRVVPPIGGLVPDPVVVEMASRYWGLRSRYASQELGYATRDGLETLCDTVTWLRAHHPALTDSQ